jgi:hypothetical protein
MPYCTNHHFTENRLRDQELRIYAFAANSPEFPFKFKKLRESPPGRSRPEQAL